MKKDTVNYFFVGLFAITGLLLLFYILLQITGELASHDEYFVELKQVTGVKEGLEVTYAGYVIGSVAAMTPVRDQGQTRYRLRLLVKSGWQIPLDSTAQIIRPALIADKQIEISEGQSGDTLSPGDLIQGVEAVDMIRLVNTLATELNQFVPKTTQDIEQFMQQMNYSAKQVSTLLKPQNMQHVQNLFKHADQSGESLAQLAHGFRRISTQLDRILNKTDQMLAEKGGDIRYSVIELKKSIDAVSSRIDSVMYNLNATSQNMNEFSRALRNNPGVILGSKPPADVHTGK